MLSMQTRTQMYKDSLPSRYPPNSSIWVLLKFWFPKVPYACHCRCWLLMPYMHMYSWPTFEFDSFLLRMSAGVKQVEGQCSKGCNEHLRWWYDVCSCNSSRTRKQDHFSHIFHNDSQLWCYSFLRWDYILPNLWQSKARPSKVWHGPILGTSNSTNHFG